MKRNSAPPGIWRDPVQFLAFGCGIGAAPYAPGTLGTVLAVPLYLALSGLPLMGYLAVTAVMLAFGIWLCDIAARRAGVHDHPGIVFDEVVGYLVTMIAAPDGWLWVLVGFGLFRLFDIAKPWPISWLDKRVPGGAGIMFDDVMAGVFALIGLQLISYGVAYY